MQLTALAATPHHDDDREHGPVTPRGMAAPPHDDRPFDGDAARPATIRIDAKGLAAPAQRRDPEPKRDDRGSGAARDRTATGDRLQGLVLSQVLLLNAFVVLLVFGWTSPLPGRRFLLGAFAVGGIVVATLLHIVLRKVRASTPESVAGSQQSPFSAMLGGAAVRALPATLVASWLALWVYALAVPPSASAFDESQAAVKPAASPPAAPRPAARNVAGPAVATKPVDAGTTREQRAEAPAPRRSPFKW